MDLISKLFIIPVLLIASIIAYKLAPLIGPEVKQHRYSSIDGLRAFLAIFVFLHHSAIWYYLIHLGKWGIIQSSLFNHFGSTSVAFFFMITAFLFFSKLINSSSKELDWTNLYTGRIMRIMPLYVIAVSTLTITTGFLTHFSLKDSLFDLLKHISQWVFFMEPNINQFKGTRYIVSGVQWSLAYEWLFYFSLALLGWLFFRIKTSIITVFITVIFFILFLNIINEHYSKREWEKMLPFLSGIASAFLVKSEKVRKIGSSKLFTPILIILLYYILFANLTIFHFLPFLSATIIFIAISCGNTFFGILTFKPFLILGQISYSIYLLHGLILFITFYYIIGFETIQKFSVIIYWITICICTIVLILLCSFTYYFIEKPCINKSQNIANKIKQFITRKRVISSYVNQNI